ncbi:Bug family tripartite tricarboxylate transporter substrate binding protein [Mycobacterium sp. NPDC003449]
MVTRSGLTQEICALSAIAGAVAALSACGQQGQSGADGNGCEFFEGKNVELVVPFETGGGFDLYGRLVANHLAEPLGAGSVIVQNEPGAGGLLGTNKTWSAKPDGLRVQLMSTSGMIAAELGGADGVQFKSADFSWIGRLTDEPDVVMGKREGGVADAAGLQARPVKIGSSGVGDIDYVEATLLQRGFNLDGAEIVTGFDGAPEVIASIARGEVDVFSASQTRADIAIKAGDVKPLWVFSDEPTPALAGVQPLGDAVDGSFKPVIEAHNTVLRAGRALAGPPDMDEARLTCLRDAFDTAVATDSFLAEAKNLGVDGPLSPLDGAKTDELITQAVDNSPKEYVDVLTASYRR